MPLRAGDAAGTGSSSDSGHVSTRKPTRTRMLTLPHSWRVSSCSACALANCCGHWSRTERDSSPLRAPRPQPAGEGQLSCRYHLRLPCRGCSLLRIEKEGAGQGSPSSADAKLQNAEGITPLGGRGFQKMICSSMGSGVPGTVVRQEETVRYLNLRMGPPLQMHTASTYPRCSLS